jgi:hypothetical protein
MPDQHTKCTAAPNDLTVNDRFSERLPPSHFLFSQIQSLAAQENECTRNFLGVQISDKEKEIKRNEPSIHIFEQMLAVSSLLFFFFINL